MMGRKPKGLLCRYGAVSVWEDGRVATPSGYCWLTECNVRYLGSSTTITTRSKWSAPLVILSICLIPFSFGFSLLFLILASSGHRDTATVYDSVEISGPRLYHLERAPGGSAFVSWLVTWQAQTLAHRQLTARMT